MKHFGVEGWIDFVQGVRAKKEQLIMQRHLRDGCQKCEAIVMTLQRLQEVMKSDAAYEPPAYAARQARAIFPLAFPEKVLSLPRMLARLVAGAPHELAMAGVRGQRSVTQHATYEAGDYIVDLRLEQEANAKEAVLVGQVTDRSQPDQPLASVPVLLTAGSEVLVRTASNEFGEFQMEFVPAKLAQLHLPDKKTSKRIEIRLQDMFEKFGIGGLPV
ncbi:MAG TPA: hypothetical protein VMX16_20100 [Terriglobia bacterium]|nr:hypothetical protein [Terriglobia bacterium]